MGVDKKVGMGKDSLWFVFLEEAGKITVKAFEKLTHIQHIITVNDVKMFKPGDLRPGQVIDRFDIFLSFDNSSNEGFHLAGGTEDIEEPYVVIMLNNFNVVFPVVLPAGPTLNGGDQSLNQTFIHNTGSRYLQGKPD